MYGRKKKILVRSSGGSCSLIFEHSNNNLTSGLTTPSLSLIERIFYMCLLYSTFPSAVYGKKTSNSNNVRRRNVSALRTRKTGLASCWTRLEADQTGWGGMFLLAFCMMTSFLWMIQHLCGDCNKLLQILSIRIPRKGVSIWWWNWNKDVPRIAHHLHTTRLGF